MRRGAAILWALACACQSGGSKTDAPPHVDAGALVVSAPSAAAPPPVPRASAVVSGPSARPLAVPKVISVVRSGTATVETTVLADESDSDDTVRTYDTWFRQNGRKQLLATNGLMSPKDAPSDSPIATKVVGNDVQYSFDGQGCPSNWVGMYEATFTASPLTLVRERVDSWNRVAECTARHEEWSWKDFAGRVTRDCARKAGCEQRESLPIPDVTLPEGYRGGGGSEWTCHRIDGCSALIDGTKGHGYVTFGTHREGDPVVHAVISGRWLFVQVDGELNGAREDDRHWVSEDHVEVWLGATPDAFDCAATAPTSQWGVRIADAKVFPGAGHPKTLRAERASCGPKTVVLRIELPELRDAVTVVYSGADEHKQRVLMATSQLTYDDGASLGTVKKIDPKRAVCVVEGERLAPRMTPVANDAAMATFE